MFTFVFLTSDNYIFTGLAPLLRADKILAWVFAICMFVACKAPMSLRIVWVVPIKSFAALSKCSILVVCSASNLARRSANLVV